MAKKKKKKTRSKKRGATKKRKTTTRARRSRSGDLASVSLNELQSEIQRRMDRVNDLYAKLDAITEDLQAVEAEIGGANGTVARRGPGRPRKVGRPARRTTTTRRRTGRRARNKASLVDVLSQVLSGKTMSVIEAADAAKKAGYKTKSENFRTIVNQTLLNNKSAFKKVARGQYTAK